VVADEVSQAIGKRGVNIKLASRLTGYEIDVYREIPPDEEDINIEEFGDELSEETIEKLKHIGCDTGKAVLELSADALSRRADLDRDTAKRVLDIIETEFEKGPGIIESIRNGRFTVESVVQPEGAETDGTSPAEPAPADTLNGGAASDGADEEEETSSPAQAEGSADTTSDSVPEEEELADAEESADDVPEMGAADDEDSVPVDADAGETEETFPEDADDTNDAPDEEDEPTESEPVREETEVKS
jgi:N utilization substance protein A